MDASLIVSWTREALRLALMLGAPALLVALVVGLTMGAFQVMTQLHEPTVAQVPRLVAVAVAILACLPWLIGAWVSYATELIGSLPGRL